MAWQQNPTPRARKKRARPGRGRIVIIKDGNFLARRKRAR